MTALLVTAEISARVSYVERDEVDGWVAGGTR